MQERQSPTALTSYTKLVVLYTRVERSAVLEGGWQSKKFQIHLARCGHTVECLIDVQNVRPGTAQKLHATGAGLTDQVALECLRYLTPARSGM